MILTGDIGGTSIRLAFWKDEKIFKLVKFPLESDYAKNLEKIKHHILSFYELNKNEKGLKIAFFAIAGALNKEEIKLKVSINLPDWENKDLVTDLKQITGCNVVLKNDTYCAAYAENKLNKVPFWYVNWGTGIGGCLVNSQDNIKTAEIGHMSLNIFGEQCRCGQFGCWDSLASGKMLEQKYQKSLSTFTNKEWREVCTIFVKGLMNLYTVYPIDIVINGGVILGQKDKLLLINELMHKDLKIFDYYPKISIARHEDLAGIKGAYELALKKLISME